MKIKVIESSIQMSVMWQNVEIITLKIHGHKTFQDRVCTFASKVGSVCFHVCPIVNCFRTVAIPYFEVGEEGTH